MNKVEIEDEGQYICTATNSVGKAAVSANVTVLGKYTKAYFPKHSIYFSDTNPVVQIRFHHIRSALFYLVGCFNKATGTHLFHISCFNRVRIVTTNTK